MDDIYDDFYSNTYYLIDKYGNDSQIETTLLNVVLVLKGVRDAFIIDSIGYNMKLLDELLQIITEYELTAIKLTEIEYLICLTVNKSNVIKNYNINPAIVLGYCYTKPDFANLLILRYALLLCAIYHIW